MPPPHINLHNVSGLFTSAEAAHRVEVGGLLLLGLILHVWLLVSLVKLWSTLKCVADSLSDCVNLTYLN